MQVKKGVNKAGREGVGREGERKEGRNIHFFYNFVLIVNKIS